MGRYLYNNETNNGNTPQAFYRKDMCIESLKAVHGCCYWTCLQHYGMPPPASIPCLPDMPAALRHATPGLHTVSPRHACSITACHPRPPYRVSQTCLQHYGMPPPASIPCLPGMPPPASIPCLPGMPPPASIPCLPDMPPPASIPCLPGMPPPASIPCLPGMPPPASIPCLPGMPPPASIPCLPGMPPPASIPCLPGMPPPASIPCLPGMPAALRYVTPGLHTVSPRHATPGLHTVSPRHACSITVCHPRPPYRVSQACHPRPPYRVSQACLQLHLPSASPSLSSAVRDSVCVFKSDL
ncbi:hypothetical protein ACOMHN_038665 [Nucella lapillus]